MEQLTVLYDPRCTLCRSARDFLTQEESYVPIVLVAAGSETARQRFPGLDHAGTLATLTVIDDLGNVWKDDAAFVTCLWALRRYREWSLRLATPAFRPHIRTFFHWFSENRHRLSSFVPQALIP